MQWTAPRDRHNLGSVVRESAHFVAGRIRRDAGQAVVEQIPPLQVDDRTLWRVPAQIRRPGEMAVPTTHQGFRHHAPGCPFSSHLRTITLHVVGQCLCCTHRHLLYPSWFRLLYRDHDRRNIVVWVSVPDASVDSAATSQRQ